MLHYLKVWLACARYSILRTLMFRGDFFIWALVELFWMVVNLLTITVIYGHTQSIAGWKKEEMILLLGTSMLIQRLLMGFFWSSIFEMGRNVRNGNFDYVLAQPGNVLFMASTRKLDPDSLANTIIAGGIILYAARELHLHPTAGQVLLYFGMIFAGLVIHYSILILSMSLSFWLRNAQGLEGGYFTLTEFSRLPSKAFTGFVTRYLFVWILPVVVVSNAPARTVIDQFGANWKLTVAPFVFAAVWFTVAVFAFNRGLRRYASASS
jgi:ABC-2 type transport system permease protein